MDCFIYHSEHKQATKGKHAVVLYRAHFPRSAGKNEAFYFHNGVPEHLKAPTVRTAHFKIHTQTQTS